MSHKTIAALYPHRFQAEAAINDLIAMEYKREDISVLSHRDLNADGEIDDSSTEGLTAAEGATAAAAGGAAGGILAALGLAAIPGIGWVLAAGPIGSVIASSLVAGAVGAVGGGITGALTSNGISEADADLLAEGVRRGGTLVVLSVPESEVEVVTAALHRHNPINLDRTVERWRSRGWNGYDPALQPYAGDDVVVERQHFEDHTNYASKSATDEQRRRYIRSYDGPDLRL